MASKPLFLAESIFEDGTLSCTDVSSSYSVNNIIDRRPYTWWQAGSTLSTATNYILCECSVAVTANSFGVIGHNFGSASYQVGLQCSSDGFNADITSAVAFFSPADDKAFLKTFTQATKADWRIAIKSPAAASGEAAKMAVAFVGDRVDFPRTYSRNAGFDPDPETIVAESVKSKAGNLLGSSLKYVSRSISLSVSLLESTWIANTFMDLWDDHLSQLKPVFYAWEITDHATAVRYVKVPDNFALNMPYDAAGYRSVALRLEGVKE